MRPALPRHHQKILVARVKGTELEVAVERQAAPDEPA